MCKEKEIIRALGKGEHVIFNGICSRVTVYQRVGGGYTAYSEDLISSEITEAHYETDEEVIDLMSKWGSLGKWAIVDPYRAHDVPNVPDESMLELLSNEFPQYIVEYNQTEKE